MALATLPLGAPLSARQLPAELAAVAGASDRAASYTTTSDTYESAARSPMAIAVVAKDGAGDRVATLAAEGKRALALLDDWLGPLNIPALTIVDLPWNSRLAGSSHPGIVTVRSRWISPVRDRALERELIAGLTRQYWTDRGSFNEGVILYTGGRAIDTLLEGSQFHSDRYVGGFLPFPLRSLALSPSARDARPRLRRYDELDGADAAAHRAARALEVAERYLGWPAMQQALSVFRGQGTGSLADFIGIASAQRGHDVSWLFSDSMREDAMFDYALSGLDSKPSTASGQFDVRVTIERRGDAVFARSLPVETRFADGTAIRDRWDARQPQATLDYVSASPAIAAAIDPDLTLILDEARANNVISVQARSWNRLALKLACDWAIWLQSAMLAYSGIV
jgi:hypothetical protein